jgi:hypothetical protein
VEKIKHSIIHTLISNPKLVDAVPKQVCLGTPKLVAHFLQSSKAALTFDNDLVGQVIKPIQQWDASVYIAK